MDFAAELHKLLRAEESPLLDPLAELARAQKGHMDTIQKNGASLSLQMEEIYDMIRETDDNAKEVRAMEKRETLLLSGLVVISDLLDTVLPYVQEHNQTVNAKKEEVLKACGLERLGFPGERLDPRLHTVASAEYNSAPLESVIRVLENGYAYHGKIIRRATVILSKGAEDA